MSDGSLEVKLHLFGNLVGHQRVLSFVSNFEIRVENRA